MDNTGEKSPLIVYGHYRCTHAPRFIRLLDERDIDYEWRDVHDEPRFGDELRQLTGGDLTVPTLVFSDGTVMVDPWLDDVLEKLRPPLPRLFAWLFKR